MQKNTAGKWIVFAFEDEGGSNPGEPVTGDALNITANVRIDGGSANAVDDTNPTELEGGYYVFDITAAEANGDLILISPLSSTSNVNVIGVPGAIYTTPPNFSALGIESDGDLTKVNTLDGHTAQTADHTASIATVDANVDAVLVDTGTTLPATLATIDTNVDAVLVDTGTTLPATLATIDGNVDAILLDTAEIGSAGAGLTAVPWNASWDAEVQSEVADALTAHNAVATTDLPSNFSSLVISGSGAADALVQGFLNNTIAETTADNIASNFETFYDNSDSTTTKTVDDVGVAGSGLTQQNVRDAMKLAPTAGAPASGSVDEALDNVEADTNELQSDWADGGRLDSILDARASQTSVDTIYGIADAILLDTGTTIPGTITTLQGNVTDILADTNELQSDWTDSGRLDVILDSILVDTGTTLPSTLATIDTNVDSILVDTGTTLPATLAALNDLSTGDIDARLAAIGLDHLVSTAVSGSDIADTSIIASLVSSSATPDWDDYDNTTESLRAIRVRGDAAWSAAASSPLSLQATTIASLSSQTSFTLTAGSSDNNAYNGAIAVITDSATSTQKAVGTVSDYVGSTKTITLESDPGIFTMAAGDSITLIASTSSVTDASIWSYGTRTLTSSGATIVVQSNRYVNSTLPDIKIGDDYVASGDGFADNRLLFESLDVSQIISDIDSMTVEFGLKKTETDDGLQVTGSIVAGSTESDCDIRVPLTGSQTAALGGGKYFFDLRLASNSKSVTVASGTVILKFTAAE